MGTIRTLAAKAKAARERNFTWRQLSAMWRGRTVYLQVLKNFRELEGSWYRGIRCLVDVFSGGT